LTVLIAGVAGFIGFHTANYFLDSGFKVIGIDSLSNLLYSSEVKKDKIKELSSRENFSFYKIDLSYQEIDELLSDVDVVVNLAGLPGQELSWSEFEEYQKANMLLVFKLLQTVKRNPRIYYLQISSSSVQGNSSGTNTGLTLSPYGVSKLGGENLVRAYRNELGLKCGILRLFSVFGPYQRPDMAYAKFCKMISQGISIPVYGDGYQSRSNTFVSDVARAIFLCALEQIPNLEADVTSSETITLLESIKIISDELGRSPSIEFQDRKFGDQYVSHGNPEILYDLLGFRVETSIEYGLRLQVRHFLDETGRK
jgi:nucleoside-diphosphate-sugar epimerase